MQVCTPSSQDLGIEKGGYLVDNIKGLNKYSSRYEYMAFEKHDFHKSKLSKLSVRVKFFVRNLISMRIM